MELVRGLAQVRTIHIAWFSSRASPVDCNPMLSIGASSIVKTEEYRFLMRFAIFPWSPVAPLTKLEIK